MKVEAIKETFDAYNKAALEKTDEFGKKDFTSSPFKEDDNYYVGIVVPALHYTMGGLAIDQYA